mmetsp:Transcript_10047/g.19852  ORF Transcript_10047/g.19852 Transcript_10047/m.19852 type:complete len:116 (-) Transcript_10047:1548-1895(-)
MGWQRGLHLTLQQGGRKDYSCPVRFACRSGLQKGRWTVDYWMAGAGAGAAVAVVVVPGQQMGRCYPQPQKAEGQMDRSSTLSDQQKEKEQIVDLHVSRVALMVQLLNHQSQTDRW